MDAEPKGGSNAKTIIALVAVVIIILAVVLIAYSLEKEPVDPVDDPLEGVDFPDGVYTYDVRYEYLGQQGTSDAVVTISGGEVVRYVFMGVEIPADKLGDYNNQSASFTVEDGKVWNDGTADHATYVYTYPDDLGIEIYADNGMMIFSEADQDGMHVIMTMRGWSEGSVEDLRPDSFTVTFMLGDWADSEVYDTVTVEEGNAVKMPAEPAYSTEDSSYAFLGWVLADGTAWDFGDEVTSDLVLYGDWILNFRITCDGSIVYLYPAITEADRLEIDWGLSFDKGGYEPMFSHIYDNNEEGTIKVKSIINATSSDAGAEYVSSIDIRVGVTERFEVVYLTQPGGLPFFRQTVLDGMTAEDPLSNPQPPAGDVFAGWSIDGERLFDFDTPITSDITLIPVWNDHFSTLVYDGFTVAVTIDDSWAHHVNVIDWGDGNEQTLESGDLHVQHTYQTAGTYEIHLRSYGASNAFSSSTVGWIV